MKSLPQLASASSRVLVPLSDVPLPPCVDRRAFLANGSLVAVAALLATACGNGVLGGSPTGPASQFTIKLSEYAALGAVGGIAKVNGSSSPVAVVRTAATTYRAFSLVCPHEGTTVSVVSGGFICPNHEAQFTSVGVWRGGQPTTNMKEYAVVADSSAGTLTIG